MSDEITISDDTLTFDEFKENIKKLENPSSPIDKTADIVSNLPSIFKALKNFDPTGISGALIDILEENKHNR